MRVVIYTHDWLPQIGGIQTVYLNLCKGLAEWPRKHPGEAVEVILVTQTPSGVQDDSQFPFPVVRQPGLRELWCLIRSADVVHVAGAALPPLFVALILRKPLVLEHHGFQTACPNGQLFFELEQSPCPGYFMARRFDKCLQCNAKAAGVARSFLWLGLAPLRRWLSNRATVNVAPTRWLATVLDLKRTKVIYHGIPPIEPVPPSGDRDAGSLFAYQGRLVSSKGVKVLLDAAQQLHRENSQFRLKIIGDGPEREFLKTQAAQMNGCVEFLGPVPDDKLREELSDVNAVVVPSLGGEVFGLVAAENMWRGKTVIVSDLGSLREVVGEGGLTFPAGDSEALCAKMREVSAEPALASRVGADGRIRAQKEFNVDAMVEGHVALYFEALQTQ